MAKVRIFTTTYCSYCDRAKAFMKEKGIAYEEVDVTGNDAARDELVRKSHGRKTVPQIFIGDEAIGGYTDLIALDQAGQLTPKLSA